VIYAPDQPAHARRAPIPLVSILLALFASGCGATNAGGPGAATSTLEEFLAGGTPLVLEENDDVINVWPMARPDARGGFLLADMQEHAIRRYTEDGYLGFTVGRQGDGPGEFQQPTVALRLAHGEVMALDMRGRVTFFDSAGTRVNRTGTLPISRIEDAAVLNDSIVIVSGDAHGAGGALSSPRLHLVNLRRDIIVASIFTPLIGSEIQGASTLARWTNLAIRGDTIAATFVLQDTIFLFHPDGTRLDAIPLPSEHFRRASPMPPEARGNTKVLTEWVQSYHLVSKLAWLPDGFLVQYQGMDEKMTPYFNLLRLSRAGERVFEFQGSPRLLTVAGKHAYLLDPEAELPNHWVRARLY
jgi:hypothetical protein